mmetsp:Transcript_84565/g.253603  ORF Transcript_84565/g.253603 Transcript_84565/m.253603 type:complete len:253 (-) Transcript_84565:502-1260(-)
MATPVVNYDKIKSRGVNYDKIKSKWRATITIGSGTGSQIQLGLFEQVADANDARRLADECKRSLELAGHTDAEQLRAGVKAFAEQRKHSRKTSDFPVALSSNALAVEASPDVQVAVEEVDSDSLSSSRSTAGSPPSDVDEMLARILPDDGAAPAEASPPRKRQLVRHDDGGAGGREETHAHEGLMDALKAVIAKCASITARQPATTPPVNSVSHFMFSAQGLLDNLDIAKDLSPDDWSTTIEEGGYRSLSAP